MGLQLGTLVSGPLCLLRRCPRCKRLPRPWCAPQLFPASSWVSHASVSVVAQNPEVQSSRKSASKETLIKLDAGVVQSIILITVYRIYLLTDLFANRGSIYLSHVFDKSLRFPQFTQGRTHYSEGTVSGLFCHQETKTPHPPSLKGESGPCQSTKSL